MSLTPSPSIKSKTAQGAYTESWRFLAEAVDLNSSSDQTLEVQTYGQLVQKYGPGLTAWDAFMLASQTINISTRHLQVIEEGSFLDTLDIFTEVPVSNAGVTFTLESTKNNLRKGFLVHIPAKYLHDTQVSQSWLCTGKVYDTDHWEYELKPLSSAQKIDVAIPVTQKLIIGASQYAAGTQQPAGLVKDYYNHYHTTRIIKESINYEGGQAALKEWGVLSQDSNGSNLKARALAIAQLNMRYQLNDAILLGQKNQNNLTQANRWAEANAVLGDDGLIPTMVAESMKQFYTGAYTEDQFDVLKFLFASQGVIGTECMMLMGPEIGLGIENGQLNLVKEYSGGSDLYDKLKGVGFGVSQFYKNKMKTYLVELPEFSNPVSYGAPGYNFESMAMIFPSSKVTGTLNGFNNDGSTIGSVKQSLNNFTMGYLNYGGENRKLIHGTKAGVNGFGIPFSDDWDDSSEYMLSEFMNIFLAMNQAILVLRTDV